MLPFIFIRSLIKIAISELCVELCVLSYPMLGIGNYFKIYAVPLISGLHCTCVLSYLSKPISVYHLNIHDLSVRCIIESKP